MTNKTAQSLSDSLNIVLTIAWKDIIDAFKNRVILSLIIILGIIMLVPKLLPLIFEQPQTVLPIYDENASVWMDKIKSTPGISVQEIRSQQELALALCGAIYPEIGLILPANFDPGIAEDEQINFQGFVCWGKRHQVGVIQTKLEELLSQSLNRPVKINVEGNILYPPTEGVLYLSLATINSIMLILMIGVYMVPSLLIEEKETKSMQALLVSPASITQIVIGKALAGLFYILLCALMMFLITWVDVIHWDMVILFVIGSGIFFVALGLLLGSVFSRQVDMIGWVTAALLILVGTVVIRGFEVKLPYFLKAILPWTPSVALAEIYKAAITEVISPTQAWINLGVVLAVSFVLYLLVIFVVRRQLVR